MHPFKYLALTPDILRLVGEIDEFKGAWKGLGSLTPDRRATLRRIATLESAGSSTRMDGGRLTDSEVESLLSGSQPGSFKSQDEEAVAGYVEATRLVFDSWRDLSLTEDHIRQIHATLLKFSQRDEHRRGNYKNVSNCVEAFDERGWSVGVIFETATPADTPGLMKELVAWTNQELEGTENHPLMVIAVFIIRYLAIHPFQDANGRLARVLTNLLLLRSGYSYIPCMSLERVVEEHRGEYYRVIKSAQDESQLMDWIRFFLSCLVQQKNKLNEKVKRERTMTALSAIDEKLLQFARHHGRLTLTSAQKVTKANRNTLKLHLRLLVQAGYLQLLGRGRSSFYETTS